MPKLVPLIVEIHSPFIGRAIAASSDPADARALLTRLLAGKKREVRATFDPVTAAILGIEADRLAALLSLLPAAPGRPPAPRHGRPARRPTTPDRVDPGADGGPVPRTAADMTD
jgi:hypothetical protein